MKKKYLLLLLFLPLLFISGCNKRDCSPCGDSYRTIPQEMKDWALFEEGSWWVYRLAEDTTVFDTVRFSSKTDFRSNKWKCDDNNSLSIPCSETITYSLQHSNKDFFPHYADTTIGGFDEINLYYRPGGGVFLYYNMARHNPNAVIFGIEPIKESEYYGNYTLIDTFRNANFNGINISQGFYSSIVTTNPPLDKSVNNIYWGKNIGRLRTEVHPNLTWELIKYEVKQ